MIDLGQWGDDPEEPRGVAPPSAMAFHGISKSYGSGRQAVMAVDAISFAVAAGEVVVLLGPNGAGKTTLLKVLGRMIAPDQGLVEIGGRDIWRDPKSSRQIGLILEGGRDVHEKLTALENIRYFGSLMHVPEEECIARARELLHRFRLDGRQKLQARHMSRGMRQALSLSVALVHQPRFVVMDEPTLGLDAGSVESLVQIVRSLKNKGVGVLITTHDLTFADALADRIRVIRSGRITRRLARTAGTDRLQTFEVLVGDASPVSKERAARACGGGIEIAAGLARVTCHPSRLGAALAVLAAGGIQGIRTVENQLMTIYLADAPAAQFN